MKRVVFVDDNPDFLDFVEQELKEGGFEVVTILDKRERDLVAEITAARPDILFIDVYLVSLDSKELCALLRAKPETKNTPLYLVSFSDKADIERVAADINADGSFSKPIGCENIAALLQKHYPA